MQGERHIYSQMGLVGVLERDVNGLGGTVAVVHFVAAQHIPELHEQRLDVLEANM